MSKLSLAGVTAVAAVPGAVLAFLLVSTLLTSFGDMPTAFVGLVGLALLCAAIATVLPVGVMLFGGRSGTVAVPKAKSGATKQEAEEEAAEASGEVAVAVDSGVVDVFEDETEAFASDDDMAVQPMSGQSTGELSIVEGQYTEDNLPKFEAEVSDANIEVFDEGVEEEFDGFEIPVDDEDDEPPQRNG